jgi:putative oxidoreductase
MDIGYMLTATSDGAFDFAVLIMRLFLGPCFVIHALGKLGLVGKGTMDGFASWLEELGVPFPALQARMAMVSELVGGALLTVGLFTRPACLVLVFTMLVAGKLGHRGAGYLITNDPPGAEYTINLAVICLAVALFGPGTFSLDAAIW